MAGGIPQGSISGPLYFGQTLETEACVGELVKPEKNSVNILVLRSVWGLNKSWMTLKLIAKRPLLLKRGMNVIFICLTEEILA